MPMFMPRGSGMCAVKPERAKTSLRRAARLFQGFIEAINSFLHFTQFALLVLKLTRCFRFCGLTTLRFRRLSVEHCLQFGQS